MLTAGDMFRLYLLTRYRDRSESTVCGWVKAAEHPEYYPVKRDQDEDGRALLMVISGFGVKGDAE